MIEWVRRPCFHQLTLYCPFGQVFFYICFLNNTFICVLLFLGAGSVFNAATSAQPNAALPVSLIAHPALLSVQQVF